MPEGHALADLNQPSGAGAIRRCPLNPEVLGRPPEQQRIADRLRRRHQQQQPQVLRQRLEASNEALLDPLGQRLCLHEPESAR